MEDFKFPEKLYKYTPYDESYIWDTLEKGQFLYSVASSFNDPFDSFPYITIAPEQEFQNYKKQRGITVNVTNYDQLESAKKIFKKYQKIYCFLCVSKTRLGIKMWSHYANRHTGVCFEIHSFSTQNQNLPFLPIEYVNTRLHIIPTSLYGDEKYREAKKVYFTKSNIWKEEEEMRSLYFKNYEEIGTINFKKDFGLSVDGDFIDKNGAFKGIKVSGFKISKVFLGVNFEGNINKVKSICKDKKIDLVQMKLKEDKYELYECPVNLSN